MRQVLGHFVEHAPDFAGLLDGERFAAGRFGVGLIVAMSLVFAAATMATYVVLCVASLASLKRVSLGPLESYGEVLSGAFIALVGLVFWLWPVL